MHRHLNNLWHGRYTLRGCYELPQDSYGLCRACQMRGSWANVNKQVTSLGQREESLQDQRHFVFPGNIGESVFSDSILDRNLLNSPGSLRL